MSNRAKTNHIIAEILNKISLSNKDSQGQRLLLEELKEAKAVLDSQIEAVEIGLLPITSKKQKQEQQ